MARVSSRRRGRRPAVSRILLRWLGVGVIVFVAFLYSQPLRTYISTRDNLESRAQEVRLLRAQKLRLERRLAEADTPTALTREARRIGYVKPGERLFIVKGIAALAPLQAPALRQSPRLLVARWTTAASSSASSGAPTRIPARRRPLSVRGRPRSPSSEPTTSAGEPFPTTYYLTCPHLVAAVSRLEAAGRRRALERAAVAAARARASLAAATAEQRRVRRELAAGKPGSTTARRSTSASAARGIPRSSSACTPTSPSRSPARATSSAIGSWRRSIHSGLEPVA